MFSRYCALSALHWGNEFDLSGSHHVIGDHLIPRRPFPIGGPLEPSLYIS